MHHESICEYITERGLHGKAKSNEVLTAQIEGTVPNLPVLFIKAISATKASLEMQRLHTAATITRL
jgi:hypothetical protein